MTRFLTRAPGDVTEWVMSSEFLTPRGKKGPQLKAGKKCDERSTKCLDVYLFGSGWDLEHSQKGARTQVQHMALKSTALLFKRKTEYFTYQMETLFKSSGILVVREVWLHSINLIYVHFCLEFSSIYLVLMDEDLQEVIMKMLTTLQADFATVLTRCCASWKCIIQGCWIFSDITILSRMTRRFHLWASSSASDVHFCPSKAI